MNIEFLIPLAGLVIGSMVKFIDLEEHGLKLDKKVFYAAAVAIGVLTAWIIKVSPVLFNLSFGVILGLIITGKIDTRAHIIAMFTFLVAVFVWAQPDINYLFLSVIVAASGVDELVNNRVLDRGKVKRDFIRKFLEVRPAVEIAVFCISALTGYWILWLTIFPFDIGYVSVTKLFASRK